MQSLEALRAWCLAHPSEVALFAYAAMNLLVALVPLRYHTHPLYGLVLRALTRLAALTPPDAPGTLKVPGAGVEKAGAK